MHGPLDFFYIFFRVSSQSVQNPQIDDSYTLSMVFPVSRGSQTGPPRATKFHIFDVFFRIVPPGVPLVPQGASKTPVLKFLWGVVDIPGGPLGTLGCPGPPLWGTGGFMACPLWPLGCTFGAQGSPLSVLGVVLKPSGHDFPEILHKMHGKLGRYIGR